MCARRRRLCAAPAPPRDSRIRQSPRGRATRRVCPTPPLHSSRRIGTHAPISAKPMETHVFQKATETKPSSFPGPPTRLLPSVRCPPAPEPQPPLLAVAASLCSCALACLCVRACAHGCGCAAAGTCMPPRPLDGPGPCGRSRNRRYPPLAPVLRSTDLVLVAGHVTGVTLLLPLSCARRTWSLWPVT